MRLFTAEERGITAVTVIVYEIMMTHKSFSCGGMRIKKQNKNGFFIQTYYLTEELVSAAIRNTRSGDISTENILL